MTITIDPELRAFVPPLTEAERASLEASIVAAGRARDPLIVWQGGGEDGADVLLDGHNRHEICTRLGLPFTADAIDLPDRAAAKAWMLEHQLARRNLTTAQRIALRVLHGGDPGTTIQAHQAKAMAGDDDGRARLAALASGKARSITAEHRLWTAKRGGRVERQQTRVSVEAALRFAAKLTVAERLALASALIAEAEAQSG